MAFDGGVLVYESHDKGATPQFTQGVMFRGVFKWSQLDGDNGGAIDIAALAGASAIIAIPGATGEDVAGAAVYTFSGTTVTVTTDTGAGSMNDGTVEVIYVK